MESTGIVRKQDALGSIVIQKEIRDVIGIDVSNPIQFFVDNH